MASISIQISIPYRLYTEHIKIKNSIKSLRFSPQTQVIEINSTKALKKYKAEFESVRDMYKNATTVGEKNTAD